MKHLRNYAQLNPLPWWVMEVAVSLTFNLTLFRFLSRANNFGLLMFCVVLSFSGPTQGLIRRLSEEQRGMRPVPLRQEEGVGLLSLSALGASLGALGVVAFGKHLGLFLPHNSSLLLLMLFSASALLSLALGYAARRTLEGHWGLRLSAAWLILLVVAACVLPLLRHT